MESDKSAASDWNTQHLQEAVPKGDYLISVNSQSEMASIVVECQNCSEWSFRDVGNELTRCAFQAKAVGVLETSVHPCRQLAKLLFLFFF